MNDETDPSAAPPAPSVQNFASPNQSLPSLRECLSLVALDDKFGVSAIDDLAKPLQSACPEMSAIVRSSAVRASLETYARQDAEAVRQQTELMREANWANICLLAAGVASALILAVSAVWSGDEYKGRLSNVTLATGVATLALGAAAAYFGYIARDQGRISRWQARRGEAEMARLDAFSTIASKAADAGPAVALFGLAVIVRHLLDDQRNWLGARALRHRKSSERTSRWGGAASALAFIGGSGAIIASQLQGTVWIVLAGVIGAAIGAYATNRDSLLSDRANADRYEKTQVALDGVAGRADEVAAKISGGEPKAVVAFTEAIIDLLSTEHKQWLEGTAQADASLQKLDAELAQLGKDKT